MGSHFLHQIFEVWVQFDLSEYVSDFDTMVGLRQEIPQCTEAILHPNRKSSKSDVRTEDNIR